MEQREILFRGQLEGAKNWIFGNGFAMNEAFASIVVEYLNDGSLTTIDVKKETVTQYTERKDVKKEMIFHGDFVKNMKTSEISLVTIKESMLLLNGIRPWEWDSSGCLKIGNIFDNPELLKND